MSYSFTGEWNEGLQQSLKSWLIETWTKINGEAPDQDLVEYILVMVKNQKKMSDISNELKDLGVEETQANDFVITLQAQLNPTVSKSTEVSVAKSTDASSSSSKLGPLKTSREKFESKDGKSDGGSSRILGSALQSSRTKDDNDRRGYDRGGRDDYKRQRYDRDNRDNRDNRDGRDGRDGYRKNPPLPPNPPPPQGAPPHPGADGGMDAIKYFEHMNQVALASGFKNAQEMLTTQREMMAMMGGGLAPPPVPYYPGAPPAPHPHYEAAHAPYYPPPAAAVPLPYDPALAGAVPLPGAEYQPPVYGGEYGGYQGGRGYSGRGYSGRGGRFNSTLAPGRGAGGGGRWYKGGSGRGGDAQGRAEIAALATGDAAGAAAGAPAAPATEGAPQAEAGASSEASAASTASEAPTPAGVTSVANYSGGRGAAFRGGRSTFRGAGRGYAGRTQAPVNKNKTWTRDTSVDASLVANR